MRIGHHDAPHDIRSSIFRTAATALVLALAAPCAWAQELGWRGSFDANGNLLFGAANSRLVSAGLSIRRADSTLRLSHETQWTYADARTGAATDTVTARGVRLSLALDYRPLATVSPFWFGDAESSLQQRIARRYGTGVGAKYVIRRLDEDEVSISLATLWEHTRPLRLPGDTTSSKTRARWSLRYRVRQRLGTAVRFTHVVFYQPSIANTSIFSGSSVATLAATLTSTLALTVTLRDRYDSEAVRRGASSNHDGQLLFGARVTFD